MTVRLATVDDAAGVAELLTTLGSPGVDAAEAARRLVRDHEHIYVADAGDGVLSGLVAVKLEHYFGHLRPVAHVTALVTNPAARRTGAAKELMKAAYRFALDRGCTGVELTCGLNPARENAHKFYRSLGFESTSLRYFLTEDALAEALA